jgi:hypothetical protein
MKRSIFSLIVLLAVSMVVVFTFQIRADNDDAVTLTVDVAQDINTYVQNNVAPHSAPDDFARGDTGIQDGTIYPAGTLPSGTAKNDPNAPGGIGKYRWVGTWTAGLREFVDAIANKAGAPAVLGVATEEFAFPDSGTSLITQGVWPNAHFTVRRPVVGGTGKFRYVVGETREVNLGENSTGGCNLRVTFILRKAKADQGP